MGWKPFKSIKKAIKKVGNVANKLDPTGISGAMLSGGTNIGGLLGKGLGKVVGGGGGGGAGKPKRERYKRKKRNRWKSKREKNFESRSKMMTSGIGKTLSGQEKSPFLNALRGRKAGTSTRNKAGKQIGSAAKQAAKKRGY